VVGGGIWDADKTWTFLRRHTRVPDPNLRFELREFRRRALDLGSVGLDVLRDAVLRDAVLRELDAATDRGHRPWGARA
jgi:hypothetical protein